MVWRRMLFGEFQDGFKVDVDLIYLKGMIQAILGLQSIFGSREHIGWKMLFE